MIESVEHIVHLLRKHTSDTLTKQEAKELQQWADENEAHADLLHQVRSNERMAEALKVYRAIDIPAP